MTTQAKLKVGQKVIHNGFEGTVYRLLEWTEDMVEVLLPGGVCVASVSEILRFTPKEWLA